MSLSASIAGGVTPASTADVNSAAAVLQAQVDRLNATPTIAHPVGSCYGGGVVYYVNPDVNAPVGRRGLIVSLTDAGSPSIYAWNIPGDTTSLISTSKLYFTGATNTNTILNGGVITPSTNAAAATAANEYTSTDSCTGCTAWYLPAQDELATLYYQSTNIPGFGGACAGYTAPSNTSYWSSTQNSILTAWLVYFYAGLVSYDGLANAHRVRPVRAF